MANKRFLSGMLITVLAFGVMGIACAEDGEGLTITDIPSRFNGMYIFFGSRGCCYPIFGAQTFNVDTFTATGARISSGRVRIPVWTEGGVRFNGSETAFIEASITDLPSLDDDGADIAGVDFGPVVFSNGSATVSFYDNVFFWD